MIILIIDNKENEYPKKESLLNYNMNNFWKYIKYNYMLIYT